MERSYDGSIINSIHDIKWESISACATLEYVGQEGAKYLRGCNLTVLMTSPLQQGHQSTCFSVHNLGIIMQQE